MLLMPALQLPSEAPSLAGPVGPGGRDGHAARELGPAYTN
jgi:hypothetical protein